MSNNSIKTDVLVIGAGVIGLSICYNLLKKNLNVILLEKEKDFGLGISSRNTETIHAGIYYKKDSLKKELCIKGKELIYSFCKEFKIKYKKRGKIFIAVNRNDISRLDKIKHQGEQNGLNDLQFLNKNQIKKIEPNIRAEAGLLSPSSGVLDSYGLMQTLMNLCKDKGLNYSSYAEVNGAEPSKDGWLTSVHEKKNNINYKIHSDVVINAAGLNSINLSKKIFSDRKFPILKPTKGAYLKYSGKSPFKHIIYKAILPGKIEERIDATPNVFDELSFGPSVEKTNGIDDFVINNKLIKKFYINIKEYFPEIKIDKLKLDQAGIRPKIIEDNKEVSDFIFDWAPNSGWLDLWGIESPGLTACFAISEHVYQMLHKKNVV